jgi:hypothetical protein
VGDKNLQDEVKFDKAKGESDTHNLATNPRDAVKNAANHGQKVATPTSAPRTSRKARP